MQKNVKYYEKQANVKLTDHQANFCQKSKKETFQYVSKKVYVPYVFKINGETYHILSENLSEDCKRIRFLHLYK